MSQIHHSVSTIGLQLVLERLGHLNVEMAILITSQGHVSLVGYGAPQAILIALTVYNTVLLYGSLYNMFLL